MNLKVSPHCIYYIPINRITYKHEGSTKANKIPIETVSPEKTNSETIEDEVQIIGKEVPSIIDQGVNTFWSKNMGAHISFSPPFAKLNINQT